MLSGITFWHWLIFAAILAGIELTSMSMYLVGPAIAAGVVALLKFFMPEMGFAVSLTIFAVTTVLLTFAARSIIKRIPEGSDKPALNQRGHQYIGREFTLKDAVVDGKGRIKIEDGGWIIRGANTEAGKKIKITGVDGTALSFEVID